MCPELSGCALSPSTSAVLSLSKGSGHITLLAGQLIVCRRSHYIGKGNVERTKLLDERFAT
jgi:hypothetical protein